MAMLRACILALCVAAAAAFMPATALSTLAPHSTSAASTITMKKCAGGGVESSKKKYRRAVRKAAWKADTPEKFKSEILCKATETKLLNMHWRVRHSLKMKLMKRAEELGVEVPANFAAWDVTPIKTPRQFLKPSIA